MIPRRVSRPRNDDVIGLVARNVHRAHRYKNSYRGVANGPQPVRGGGHPDPSRATALPNRIAIKLVSRPLSTLVKAPRQTDDLCVGDQAVGVIRRPCGWCSSRYLASSRGCSSQRCVRCDRSGSWLPGRPGGCPTSPRTVDQYRPGAHRPQRGESRRTRGTG